MSICRSFRFESRNAESFPVNAPTQTRNEALSIRETHLVLCSWIEEAYPDDPLSSPREATSYTVHASRVDAISRLVSELDHDMTDDSVECFRRSVALTASVPEVMAAKPHRWVSDRVGRLGEMGGIGRNRLVRAFASGCLGMEAERDMALRVHDLARCLEGEPFETLALAMACGAACMRVIRHAPGRGDEAGIFANLARDIGNAASDGRIPNEEKRRVAIEILSEARTPPDL